MNSKRQLYCKGETWSRGTNLRLTLDVTWCLTSLTDLFSLYVLFSQYRSCDNTLQGVSQKFASLITCDITFDRNYTSPWYFLKTFIALLSTVSGMPSFVCYQVPTTRCVAPRLGRTSCGDWNSTIFACLFASFTFLLWRTGFTSFSNVLLM